MPRKKASEVTEDEVQEPVVRRNETTVTRWFNDYCVDNKDDIKIICDAVARSAEQQFSLYLKSDHTESYAVIFYSTFVSILEFLRKKQKMYKEYTILIGNSLNIGYCNNDDENNEKVGNFMPIIESTGMTNRVVSQTDMSDIVKETTAESYIRWKELNTKKNAEAMHEIQEMTYQYLKREFKLSLRTSEAVIPLFATFIDVLMGYLKHKYKELIDTNVSEVSMKVLGLFEVFYSYNQDTAEEVIEFQPSVFTKLQLKSDEQAEK